MNPYKSEKDLLNDIFKGAEDSEQRPNEELTQESPEIGLEKPAYSPIPLKTVEQILRDAKNPPEDQKG